jgi:flavin reductase (DIM6/NTAB) family NADH-FMN oxidoreductase RutF
MTSRFEQLVATLDYPLYVVTTAVEGERAGYLIGFATQCSIHPPRFLACISNRNRACALARIVPRFFVGTRNKILDTGGQATRICSQDRHVY